jgi:hypothetical protein
LQVTVAGMDPAYCAANVDRSSWIAFNEILNRDARLLPNEALIERRLQALGELESDDPRVFWLTVARIVELAVMLAGAYADSCEFQAAGDLLVNPRRVDVYRRGSDVPVVKDRHRALSDQFASAIGCENPVAWLCRETLTHIRKAALLPSLKRMLCDSGILSPDYLNHLERRMQQVADTIAFLSAWQVHDGVDLFQRLAQAGSADREALADHLCSFGRECFDAMGDDIDNLIHGIDFRSIFLIGCQSRCRDLY